MQITLDPAHGKDFLPKAREVLAQARAVKELCQAQSVILPLEFGFPWNRRL